MTTEKPVPSSRLYGRESLATRGMVIATGLAVAIGGYLIPVLGWVAGVVMMWLSPVWTRTQKLIVTLAPIVAAAIAALVPVITDQNLVAWHALLVFVVVSPLPIGIWLLVVGVRRLKS
ncbi:hypothetical protein [Microbacterium sp. ZW T5_56]|uniref:hypothetical protein n=1 Tax=Microbacterium sp. ZW T5_56 TaxID=3378081 RepID=UPI0038549966